MEKRNTERHKAEYSIACAVFTSQGVDNISCGKIKNFGKFGVYAEMQDCFKEGTILLLKTPAGASDPLPAEIEEGFRSITVVEVKWSTPLFTDEIVRFGSD
jgi:hypothetical protein